MKEEKSNLVIADYYQQGNDGVRMNNEKILIRKDALVEREYVEQINKSNSGKLYEIDEEKTNKWNRDFRDKKNKELKIQRISKEANYNKKNYRIGIIGVALMSLGILLTVLIYRHELLSAWKLLWNKF